jgi:putative nucleotidyltransferase with HDIG domain
MNDPSTFLHSLGQALAVMGLYAEGHPSRERAIDAAFHGFDGLSGTNGKPSFTFLDGEVVYGRDPMRDFKDWDWGNKLAGAGIQRIEVERKVSRDEFEGFLQEIYARLTHSAPATSENRQMRSLGVRFGSIGVQGMSQAATPAPLTALHQHVSLGEEVDTLRWLQGEVQSDRGIPLIEAEAIVRSLSVAMHADRQTVLPLLQLKEFDQYTTTHSLNVAVLSMALAETVGCRSSDVRAFGVAGLLHDIGKIRIPIEVLTKPGKLSAEERDIVRRHPVDGAQLIMESDQQLDLAAVVAYEHHMMLDGCGYPATHYGSGRASTLASRLVHVCDVFDALRTKRPYRDAWESEQVFAYLLGRAGTDFDPALVTPFVDMMRRSELRVSPVPDAVAAVGANTAAAEDDVRLGR